MATTVSPEKTPVLGYLPQDNPPIGSMISLGIQQVLTMFPATVLVAILTKFDVGVTLLASGLGTIIGSSANVVVASISEKTRTPITPKLWNKRGLPVMFTTLIVTTILFTLAYPLLSK